MVRVTTIAAGVVAVAVKRSTEEVDAIQEAEAIEEAEARLVKQKRSKYQWVHMERLRRTVLP